MRLLMLLIKRATDPFPALAIMGRRRLLHWPLGPLCSIECPSVSGAEIWAAHISAQSASSPASKAAHKLASGALLQSASVFKQSQK